MENYISLQKSQLLDSLENQVRFSQLVAVLVGEEGIGKSYTLKQLQNRLSDEICVAHIDASLEIQEEQLQKVICLQLGLPSEQFDSLEHIEKSIRTHLRKKALISIDNAHLLSNESLNSLLRLNQNQINHQESVLFLLLAGDESLPKNISFTNTFKSHQEMCVVFQLEAIEKSEVGLLVGAISQLTTEEVDETFGNKQLDYFWQLSKGIPAELEYQVSRWKAELPEEHIDIEEVVEERANYWKAVAYMVLSIVFVSILFYQDEINQIIMSDKKTSEINVSIKQKKIDSKHKTKKLIYKGDSNKGEINKAKNDKDGILQAESIIDKNINQKNPDELKINKLTLVNTDKIIDKKEAENLASFVTMVEKEKIEDKNKLQKSPEQKQTNSISNNIQHSTQKTNKEIANATDNATRSIDEKFLLSQPSSYLALQWVGVSSKENAQAFRSNHPLKTKMYIYRRKQSNNTHLYLVVSDLLTSRSKVSAAREKYKNLNYQGTPWVKSLLAIQNEIKGL